MCTAFVRLPGSAFHSDTLSSPTSSFPSELFLSLPSFYAEQLSLGCVLICLGIYIYISEMRGGGKLYEEISASIYLGGGNAP